MNVAGDQPLLDVRELSVDFGAGAKRRRVVDRVSFSVAPGRTLGIVGESGSGKTTLVRAVLRLIPAVSGEVRLLGRDVLRADRAALRAMRRQMQMIFQDPFASLNPRHTVERIVMEGLAVHDIGEGDERRKLVADIVRCVGLSSDHLSRFPHELSGGQRQRVAIARALVLRPKLVICDEPVSALDVSVQAQILNLLMDLQEQLGLTYLFIGHHLGVIRQVCHEVAVMQAGRFVEYGPTQEVLDHPRESYTQELVRCVLEVSAEPS